VAFHGSGSPTLNAARWRWRSLSFHAGAHLGVVLAAAVAATVLVGALTVGDSVRETLRRRALDRIGKAHHVLDGGDRYFGARPGGPASPSALADPLATFALRLPGVVTRQDGAARANQVRVYGVPKDFGAMAPEMCQFPHGQDGMVALNQALARHLSAQVGDELVLRLHKPSALSQDAVISPRDGASVALRVRVGKILGPADWGDFSVEAGSLPPFNLFMDHAPLAKAAGLDGRANLALLGRLPAGTEPEALASWVSRGFTLADAELEVRPVGEGAPRPALPTPTPTPTPTQARPPQVELASRRIFLDPVVTKAVETPIAGLPRPVPVLTYMANAVATDERSTPYSMITAAGAPFTPEDMADDEMLVNAWLAEDLGVGPGDRVSVLSYRVDTGSRLVETTNGFRVRGIVPMEGLHADPSLMPEFPGLAKAESTQDWDAGFELTRQIRDQDEAYWKRWRGTPKAFITLAAGRSLWANRFGDATAIRWFKGDGATGPSLAGDVAKALKERLNPADLGLRFQPLSGPAMAAARGGQDFGGLFIGFSLFLIVSALLLLNLVFRFGIDRRTPEIGTLLALGWTPAATSRLFFGEGLALAAIGAVLGIAGGVVYGWAVLMGLNTLWNAAVAGASLEFHPKPASLAGGAVAATAMVAWTQWRALRRIVRRSPRELLQGGPAPGEAGRRGVRRWWPILTLGGALALSVAGFMAGAGARAGMYFGAGAAFLGFLLAMQRRRLLAGGNGGDAHAGTLATWSDLTARAPARQPDRSAAVISLLGVAVFLIVAVAANRLDASRDARDRRSGTGGFTLWASSSLPVTEDLDTGRGRERAGLDPKRLAGVSFVPMRVREGDDASCLNLQRAQRPRLLGVQPEDLSRRRAFTFQALAADARHDDPWMSLAADTPVDAPVPAIGDANSIQWALGRRIGDTIDLVDERGRPFRIRLVGAVANSLLQGQLLISEREFLRRFPGEAGHRAFLIDTEGPERPVAEELTRGLADLGLEVSTSLDRLNRFNAVQNTYLNTFQWLGGLGLLLGSVGLGLVVQRNVLERRAELAVMAAVGFPAARIRSMLLSEHLRLLVRGLAIGIAAALWATAPAWVADPGGLPWAHLGMILGAVFLNGVAWTWFSTRQACRGDLLPALRGE